MKECPPHKHGTTTGYHYYGCRCVECREAENAFQRQKRHNKKAEAMEFAVAQPDSDEPREILDDPPVRGDGLCVVCEKPRKPERSRQYGGIEAERDPFCSVTCCREWHKNPVPAALTGGAKRKYDHGVSGYRLGCRCNVCKEAKRDEKRAQRQKVTA